MAALQPLTRTSPPKLDFSRPGTPAASDFGDIYFSTDGGLEETRAVFLDGCGLPDGWQNRRVFTIAELGFGSGLNFLATCQRLEQTGGCDQLHFISVEAHPFERDDLRRALSAFPELEQWATPLINSWPGPVKGIHRRHFNLMNGASVHLTLIHDEVGAALVSQRFKADCWFLDGFSPAKNPDMWSPAVMMEIARLSAPGARLATFTAAGAVRNALKDAGFGVDRKEGFGRKRHRLEARFPGQQTDTKLSPAPTIIGAGIAGASIAAAFKRRGMTPTIMFDPDHVAASGNGAALIKPRLDLQDRPESRFFLSSFLYARDIYREATRHEGLRHLPKDVSDKERHERIVINDPLGAGHLEWGGDHLCLPSSLVIDTEIAREILLGGVPVQERKIENLSTMDGPVILACGYGIRSLLPDTAFRFSRGQLSWTNGDVNAPVTYGGYAIPINDRILLGATHARIDNHDRAFEIDPEDDQANLKQAQARGLSVGPDVSSYRASVRVNSPDTLPRLARWQTKTGERFALSGLGSRGFVFAPLLGEALVCDYLAEPSPLDATFKDRISRLPQ